ncbi:hypothetical protein [Peteryoungia ipomoeae]|uniref:Uncharacterized protein n=1 Tax=Peteryoungia ipomoeae TaxID=1210932 RepID=A0A4S8PAJ8_9HYPH|nr:hypothetical protein [Peteryoungia ipomoeae]THV25114.1 hypothetical protein FAA97_02615 [Peteryoungia ipomoeae]
MDANRRDHGITETIRSHLVRWRRNRALHVALGQIAELPHHLRRDLEFHPTAMDHINRSIGSNTFVCLMPSGGAWLSS